MKVLCPNCLGQVRLTREQILVQHDTPFGAPCRLSNRPRPMPTPRVDSGGR